MQGQCDCCPSTHSVISAPLSHALLGRIKLVAGIVISKIKFAMPSQFILSADCNLYAKCLDIPLSICCMQRTVMVVVKLDKPKLSNPYKV